MIIESMVLIGNIVIFSILIAKLLNLLASAKLFQLNIIIVSLIIALTFWAFSFFGFIGSIGNTQTSTIIDGSSIITVTQNENAYTYLYTFIDFQNMMMGIILILTIVEIIYYFKLTVMGRVEGRLRN